MTPDNVIFLCAGFVLNGLTFALGVAVGLTLRKDSDHDHDRDNDSTEESPSLRCHLPLDIGAPHRPQLRGAGSANQNHEADPAKRPAR
jgi:hypothetical protein